MPAFFSFTVAAAPSFSSSTPIPSTGATDAGETAPRDEALDLTGDGDQLITDGDQILDAGQDGVLSDVLARWQMVKGEWYLDTSRGVDWFGVVLVKNPNLSDIRAEFVREALKAPGVVAVLLFEGTVDAATRTLDAQFQIQDNLGNIISDSLPLSPGGTT